MKAQEAKHDAEEEPLARRVAVLEEKLLGVLERHSQLDAENRRLRGEVTRLKQRLAAARKGYELPRV